MRPQITFNWIVWAVVVIGVICGVAALALGPYGCATDNQLAKDVATVKAEQESAAAALLALKAENAKLKAVLQEIAAGRDVSWFGGFANNWKVIVGSAAPAAAAAGLGGWKLGKRKK